jgi:prevent-host-death family protein
MKTITITEAKRQLGHYLKRAASGEEIGIVSGADIISLRKVEVIPVDRIASSRVREAFPPDEAWPVFVAEDGGPVDGALYHDKYIYDDPHGHHARKSRA